ncbi:MULTISPECIES: STAS domain-containing protein [unclassified Streptomyces]|uniref:STAS domain-containing protein n=1 Tax=unclassified Streptomyces TaxID=2593676 RepID=UPI000DBA0D6B|nr:MULTISPECIES: STAS domain-containing protein [unclassified Streptomyces]MYT73813.1 STAS domain-containing protein [Streptomyces sp. SID8367]RAJ89225.1 anti-sigma B factor antagonist [Streptomyces sp. PsTaAH-137]
MTATPHPHQHQHSPSDERHAAVVTRTDDGDTVTIVVGGRLEWDDAALTVQLSDVDRVTIVDLRELTWADSALLNALLHAQRQLRRTDGHLILRGPLQPVVRRLFDLTGTASYFTFAEAGEDD